MIKKVSRNEVRKARHARVREKVSGTASESDLKLDDKPVEEEVLDEHAIKREVQMSDAEFRGKMIYMAVFLGVIILALLFMPLIFKLLHL